MADSLADELFGTTEPVEAETPHPEPVPQEPAPVEPQQPVEEPEPATDSKERFIPLSAVLDEREKRQAAERERDELRRQAEERQVPQEAPDPYDDPKGFAAHIQAETQKAVALERLSFSEQLAEDAHGKEKVAEAAEWAIARAAQDPSFKRQYLSERHPFDWIVRQHQREAIVKAIPSDVSSLDELIEREVQKRMQNAPAAPQAPAVSQQPASGVAVVPRSLATAPGSGGKMDDVALGLDATMDAVFKR